MVLGTMYVIYALFHIIACLKAGYWHGILNGISRYLLSNIKIVIMCIIAVLLSIGFIDQSVSLLCKNSMGEGWFVFGVLFTLSLVEGFREHFKNAIAFRIAFMTSMFAGLVNGVLKFVFNRERPVISMHEWHFFKFFIAKTKNFSDLLYAYNSMPSGHTIMVASAVAVLYLYSTTKVARVILVLLVILMAYARIYTMNHWFSDVLVSMMLGFMVGMVGYNINKFRLL
jgi:membrane-associated phospholipid phosphatase